MKYSIAKRLLIAIAVNLGLLVVLFGYVASLSYPASEATRLRNALLLDVARATDIEWTPQAIPPSFKREYRQASPRFLSIVKGLGIERLEGDWNKALALAAHLTENAKDLGAIKSDLETTYAQIVSHGRGYCADFTQVYLALAHAAGLFAREWAFSFDGFGGHGHALIEVYDRQRERWLWLDVYNNVHATDALNGEPLSAGEFRGYVVGTRGNVAVRRNGPGRLGYQYTDKLLDYYRRGASEWYLWAGNAVFSYEANPLVSVSTRIAPSVGQLAAIGVGVHPRIKILPNEGNVTQVERMKNLGVTLYLIGLLVTAQMVVLLWQLWLVWRWRVIANAMVVPSDPGLVTK